MQGDIDKFREWEKWAGGGEQRARLAHRDQMTEADSLHRAPRPRERPAQSK